MRTTVLIFIFIINVCPLFGQYSEVGIQFGLSNYVGELSENKMKGEGYGTLIGVFGRYNFTKHLSAKVSLSKGTLSGDDRYAKSVSIKERNLNFRSDILEFAFVGEYNLAPYNIRSKETGVPYLFAGIGVVHFNPQAQMRGSWYDLQPMKTEGVPYSRYTVAVPFGIGMKFNISYKVNFGFEFGARKTFTDYLDDVSGKYIDVIEMRKHHPVVAALAYRTPELTGSFGENPLGTERGNPENQDWYFFGGITVSINLTDKYGLDFDKKYEMFKEHLKKPEKINEDKLKLKQSPDSKQEKKKGKNKFRLFKKKQKMKPFVKKIIDQ